MTRRGGTRHRATRKPVVVLAGEDSNDRKSLCALLEEICPQMRGRLVEIRDSVRLQNAGQKALAERVDTLARKVRARAARERAEVACVFVHEDRDAPDGDGCDEARERVQRALTAAFGNAHYVLSVWEMEAWLLLFPEALTKVVSTWSVPGRYRNCDTGRLTDPKRIVMGECTSSRTRYSESHAPAVFAAAAELGLLDRPAGSNRSWSWFRDGASECCQRHIPRQRGS